VANLEELVVSLVAETSGLRAELQKATSATKEATNKMDKAIEEFSNNSGKNLSFFETAAASAIGFLGSQAVLGAVNMVGDALKSLGGQLLEGANAAIAEEAALKRLANSLAISGNYSEAAMKGLQGFASEMETLTGVQDDVVAGNLAVLASLTKLDAEGLKKAQKAAIDFSAATGKDLESATQMVAKAVNGSTDAFGKMGIKIAETTDKSQNLKNVVEALNGQFGGAAAGAAQTFGGAVTNLTNAWGNLMESLAVAVTQNPVVIAMMNQLTSILQDLTGSAQSATVMLQTGLAAAFLTVTEALGVFAGMLDTVFGGLTDKFGNISGALAEIHGAGERAFDKIGTSGEVVTATIANQTTKVHELNEAYKEKLATFAQGLADQGAALDNHYQYETQLRQLNLEAELSSIQDHNAAKFAIMEEDIAARQELLAAQQEQEWIDLQTAHANGIGTEAEYNAAKTALAQKHFLDVKKLENEKTKNEQAEQKMREANMASTLNTIATLQNSSSKELAAIGKAAAVSTATIDGIVAVQKALSSAPPPFNFILAGLVGVAAAANVAKIAGVGLNDGGTLVGGGANRDTVPANLTKGETVVTRDLTDKMNDFFSGGGQQGGGQVTVVLELKDSLVEFIEAKILERQAANVSLLGPGVV
jgi:hypothetical protein